MIVNNPMWYQCLWVNALKMPNKVVDKQVVDGENPVAKVPLYINSDINDNSIMEPLIEDIAEEKNDNETAE